MDSFKTEALTTDEVDRCFQDYNQNQLLHDIVFEPKIGTYFFYQNKENIINGNDGFKWKMYGKRVLVVNGEPTITKTYYACSSNINMRKSFYSHSGFSNPILVHYHWNKAPSDSETRVNYQPFNDNVTADDEDDIEDVSECSTPSSTGSLDSSNLTDMEVSFHLSIIDYICSSQYLCK